MYFLKITKNIAKIEESIIEKSSKIPQPEMVVISTALTNGTNPYKFSKEEVENIYKVAEENIEQLTNFKDTAKEYDIEDAPDDFDIDSLLNGMAKVGRNTNAKVRSLADNLKSEYPYFKVELSKLTAALKVASLISSGLGGKNPFSKAVGFKANAKTRMLRIYSSDFQTFFSYEIPLFRMDKNETVCESYFAVPYPILSKLIMACDGVISVYEKNMRFYLKLIEGDIEIETMKIHEDIQICTEKPVNTHESIDTAFLKSALQTLYPYASLAVDIKQRRVYVVDNTFYAQFMFSCARLKSPQDIPNMDLAVREMKILYVILNATNDTQLTIKSSGKRIFFEGERFVFTTMIVGGKIAQEFIGGIDGLIFKPQYQSAIVLTSSISKITDLSDFLMYSIKRLQFNFGENNTLLATMLTKTSNSEFCIGSISDGINVNPFKTPIVVLSSFLRGMLKLFKNCKNVNFYITPHGIGIKQLMPGSNMINIEAVMYTEHIIEDFNKENKA